MKRLSIAMLFFPVMLYTQEPTLSLQKAYELAQQNYPLIKQRDLIKQTTGLSIENLSKGFLPQFSLNAQATYQSAVTEPKFTLPGGTFIEILDKDQYRILGDVNQLIYDGGSIRQQKNIQQLNEEVEQQRIEVELYKLKERINQVFFGVLYLDEQLMQVELVKADLNNGIKKVEAQVNNGTAFRSNLHLLNAELLKTDQRTIELKANRKGLLDVLALFINQDLPENTRLERPRAEGPLQNEIARPELKLYSTQEKLLGGQYRLVDSRNRPKASLFFQGGYGKPGLNMFVNGFDFYYTTGVRLNWQFGGLYTQKREKKIIELNQKTVDIQKEVFLLNTNSQLKEEQSEVEKLQKLIDTDKEIIDLRIKVKDAAKAQLENGVITANDYLREVNAEDLARQSLITHQIQLLQAQINYHTISGKQ
ncbi:MAG TPA: TolC family protein [Chitinophagaceae bacterium]